MGPIIAIVGAGYVGMQMAVEIARAGVRVFACDCEAERIKLLVQGSDNYVEKDVLKSLNIVFTHDMRDIAHANYYIATVPTPINKHLIPDLLALKQTAKAIGQVLKKGDVVIYESTVFPGATEELIVVSCQNRRVSVCH